MPARHRIDNEAKLLITTWEGDATDVKFIEDWHNTSKKFNVTPTTLTTMKFLM